MSGVTPYDALEAAIQDLKREETIDAREASVVAKVYERRFSTSPIALESKLVLDLDEATVRIYANRAM